MPNPSFISSHPSDIRPSPQLTATAISVAYPGAGAGCLALRDVSIAPQAGQVTAVVGPNGSGKSTLIRALSRTLAPSAGTVTLDGHDLYADVSATQSALSIAVVPQAADPFLDFTLREIVSMGRSPHRAGRGMLAPDSPHDMEVVNRALEQMRLTPELADRPATQVSGGERQRALIARALAQEAPILLFDEPTSALDLGSQLNLLEELRRLATADGRTVLLTLHDLNLAVLNADRIVVLHEGRVVADGHPAEVLTPELVESAYGVRCWIRPHPVTGAPTIVPLPRIERGGPLTALEGLRVHVFCGGGAGAWLLFALAALGARVTAGVLPADDADRLAADDLGISYIGLEPFCAASAADTARSAALEGAAETAMVAGTPIGTLNKSTFDSAVAFAASGRPLVVVKGQGTERREVEISFGSYPNVLVVERAADAPAALAGLVGKRN